MSAAGHGVAPVFAALGLQVFERGWLSSNNVLLQAGQGPATVIDTGYVAHAAQTVALVERGLGTVSLECILNTHLHSDHCGGNAALQQRWPRAQTMVPHTCFGAAAAWDAEALTFEMTDQRCDRFRVDAALREGDELWLGPLRWQVHAAPGHDPTAVMLFEPAQRVLISGDALWERRLAIVFPELVGEPGFDDCLATLQTIERLSPAIVIPGHGAPFTDVAAAVAASRARVEAFAQRPDKHRAHAVRALVMFHMLEIGACPFDALADWLCRAPIVAHTGGVADKALRREWAKDVVEGLVSDGALRREGDNLHLEGRR